RERCACVLRRLERVIEQGARSGVRDARDPEGENDEKGPHFEADPNASPDETGTPITPSGGAKGNAWSSIASLKRTVSNVRLRWPCSAGQSKSMRVGHHTP